MRKLLFAVSAIAALSLLLVAGAGIAEPTHPNEVGLYMTNDGLGATGGDARYYVAFGRAF